MTDNTYPRRVLTWKGSHQCGMWQHEDGRLTTYPGTMADLRETGWVVDTRVDLPQDPPEPEIEPGWYLARADYDGPFYASVMRLDASGRWYLPGGHLSGKDWQIIARLTPEQVAAIEGQS